MQINDIQLIHQISDTYRELYYFNIDSYGIHHKGTMRSYRNDENDIWGDEWSSHFADAKKEDYRIVDEKYEDADEDSNPEYSMALKKVQDKYNPVLHKTIRGETRYSGTFGRDLPKPLMTLSEIKHAILEEIIEFLRK